MAVEFEVIRVTATTTVGLQTITASFAPKGVMMWMGKAIADNSTATDIWTCVGYTDGTNAVSITGQSEDAIPTSDTRLVGDHSNNVVLQQLNNAGFVESKASISSFSGNDIIINWTTAPSDFYLITVVVFGGADVEAQVGSVISTVGTGNTKEVTTTFGPDLVLFIGPRGLSETIQNNRVFMFGASDKSLNQACIITQDIDLSSIASGSGRIRNDRCAINDVGANNHVEMTAMGASSFTLTTRGAVGGLRYGYMALDLSGASAKVRTTTTPASVSSVYDSSFGFEPIGALHLQTPMPGLNIVYQGVVKGNVNLGDCYTLGAFTGNTVESQCWLMDDGNTTMVAKDVRQSGSEVSQLFVRSTSTTAVLGVVPTPATDLFQANGIEVDWTILDATHGVSKYYIQVAIGNDPVVAAGDVDSLHQPDMFFDLDYTYIVEQHSEDLEELTVVDSDSFSIDPDFLFADLLPEGNFPPAEQLIGSKDNPASDVVETHFSFGTPYTPGAAGKQNYYISAYEKSVSSVILSKDKIYYLPLYVAYPILIKEIGVHITTVHDGTCAKIGLYDFDRGIPKEAIFRTAIDLGGSAYAYAPTDIYINAGLYLLAILSESESVAMFKNEITRSIFAQDQPDGAGFGSANRPSYLTEAVTFATGLPATAGEVTLGYDDSPRIICKLG